MALLVFAWFTDGDCCQLPLRYFCRLFSRRHSVYATRHSSTHNTVQLGTNNSDHLRTTEFCCNCEDTLSKLLFNQLTLHFLLRLHLTSSSAMAKLLTPA